METREDYYKNDIVLRLIEDEMKSSFLDYAMSVIVARALPDVRDGLKPVHRRVLFAMHELGLASNKPFKKSARIVGDTMGRYHPHGDIAIYDTLVRLAQDFSMRYMLVQGQGNFGSIDGDNAAAMRYTEARLSKVAEDMLEDLNKDTVDFVPNFDETLKEPCVLPSKFPNLLANGTSGIAVGMATNIPPHNIKEISDGLIYAIDNPTCDVRDLMNYIKGPDFPTGAIIVGHSGIVSAYQTGKGRIVCRAKTEIEEKHGKHSIIVTEIPYQTSKSLMIQEIAELVRDKKIQGISDIRDESDRKGIRIVIDIKKDFTPNVVLNQLFKHSRLQVTFGANMVVLVNNEPKLVNLKDMIFHFIDHRREVVRRRTTFELDKAKKRAHILEGLLVALKNIDEVVKKIKSSKDVESANAMLIHDYNLSNEQAKAILDMRLQKLASLEQQKINEEYKGLQDTINQLVEILASEKKILEIIKKEILEIKEKYSDDRRTDIIAEEEEFIEEDLIKEEEVVVTISHEGYIKRVPVDTYKKQHRGGKGIIATTTKEEDFTEHLFTASTHSYILFFTNRGKVYWLKVYEIPEGSRQAKGKPIVNMIDIGAEEKISAFIPVKEFSENMYLMVVTKNGIVKKTPLVAYSRPRATGIIAVTLDEGDDLVEAKVTSGGDQIIIATKNGMACRFEEKDVRPMGRSSRGVIGINLKDGDEVIAMVKAKDDETLLTVTENGYGKRSKVSDYRLIKRGGTGVINIQTTERNGNAISVKSVTDEDEILLISKNGIIIRVPCNQIPVIGRNTQGVKLMNLENEDKVVAAAIVINEEDSKNGS